MTIARISHYVNELSKMSNITPFLKSKNLYFNTYVVPCQFAIICQLVTKDLEGIHLQQNLKPNQYFEVVKQ